MMTGMRMFFRSKRFAGKLYYASLLLFGCSRYRFSSKSRMPAAHPTPAQVIEKHQVEKDGTVRFKCAVMSVAGGYPQNHEKYLMSSCCRSSSSGIVLTPSAYRWPKYRLPVGLTGLKVSTDSGEIRVKKEYRDNL